MKSTMLVALLGFAALCAAYEKEDGVLVLGDSDLADAVQEFEYILVEFYAPWCGHCKTLAPEYVKAAAQLEAAGITIPLAKVDATQHSKVAGDFGIRGYPTLKWFVKGKDSEYNGGRTAEAIVNWIKKKTGPPCKVVSSEADLTAFKAEADVTVVAFLDTASEEFKTVEDAARGLDDFLFAVGDASLAAAVGESFPSVVLFKNFDEGKATFSGDYAVDALTSFVQGNAVPLISTFSQESAPKIFGAGIETHFLYFNDESSASHADTLAALREVAVEFKGKTLFVFVPHTEDRVLQFFDFTADNLPKGILINMGAGDMKKYGFSKELTAENIRAHVTAYHNGELKPTLKSEEIPADNNGPVTVIVGKNFEDVVLDQTKDVLIEFYAPWCGHCKSLAPTWDKLGAHFASTESIVIAKVDATANDIDHPKVNVKGFPTILFFPANDKANPVTYNGGRDLEDLVKFLDENATAKDSKKHAAHEHVDL